MPFGRDFDGTGRPDLPDSSPYFRLSVAVVRRSTYDDGRRYPIARFQYVRMHQVPAPGQEDEIYPETMDDPYGKYADPPVHMRGSKWTLYRKYTDPQTLSSLYQYATSDGSREKVLRSGWYRRVVLRYLKAAKFTGYLSHTSGYRHFRGFWPMFPSCKWRLPTYCFTKQEEKCFWINGEMHGPFTKKAQIASLKRHANMLMKA